MFDAKKFNRTKFEPRVESVPVADLKEWFVDGAEPVWTVRGLTGAESARINEAVAKVGATHDLAAAMASAAGSREKIDSILSAAGLPADKATPADLVRRMEMLVIASVSPECDMQTAMQLAKAFPVVFFDLTNRIPRLTGLGHIPGKRPPSGDSPASEH